MSFHWDKREHLALGRDLLRWMMLSTPVALMTGSACALFLWALDWATKTRQSHGWLLFLLPFAGAAIGGVYHRFGKSSEAGNNLLIDAIHAAENDDASNPQEGHDDNAVVVPRRMAPLILLATVVTHLFGGSAGREGTALQMGGSIAAFFASLFRLDLRDRRLLLLCGMAAGFGGIFGTPLAGAVFALEVLTIGRVKYEFLVPCLFAALLGDATTSLWGTHHTLYHIAALIPPSTRTRWPFDWWLALKIALASVAFGWVSLLFAELTHGVGQVFKAKIASPILRPMVGGALLIALTLALGTRDYLGLGVSSPDPQAVTIVSSFHAGGADTFSWWWKLLFTALTLSCGFKGGEVTPLFFIGAALGNVLGGLLGAPIDLFAGLGFIAVFAGATNTPLACTLMGIELFGSDHAVYFAIACFLSYFWSGQSGIYLSQRIGVPKRGEVAGQTLRQARAKRAGDDT